MIVNNILIAGQNLKAKKLFLFLCGDNVTNNLKIKKLSMHSANQINIMMKSSEINIMHWKSVFINAINKIKGDFDKIIKYF